MSMELYMMQLSEDLRLAAKMAVATTERETASLSHEGAFERHLLDVERYIHGSREPLSQVLGFEKAQLPPTNLLTTQQQEALFADLNTLLNAHNFYAEFPETLPAPFRYGVLRENWDMECVYVSSGCSHLEFCSYEPAECPFPKEHCMCRDLN